MVGAMADDLFFSNHDMRSTIENHKKKIREEIDEIADERLLATDVDELINFIQEKWGIEFPVLGEPEASNRRTKMQVGRYGYDHGYGAEGRVSVDAESYILEVPFEGDRDLFFHRGNTFNYNPPRGSISGQRLFHTYTMRQPNADQVNEDFEKFLADIEQHLGWLRPDVEAFNASIPKLVKEQIEYRRERSTVANDVASGLKFKMRKRDQAPPLSMPVKRKKVNPTLPKPKETKLQEPILSDARYEEILGVLRNMSVAMERSPHAFAGMDEETLRFQFLVPLNGQFETDARGEVFNSNGKTDILITEDGRNIFIAECKIWRGEDAHSKTVDQILGYLSWRDTKAAIILFNKNKNFSQVLAKIPDVMKAHPNFVREIDRQLSETEFRYLFKHKDDAERQITLSVLAFDVPK